MTVRFPERKTFSRIAPAKINLMLAVTGPRADGFHGVVSLVAPVPALHDSLEMTLLPDAAEDVLVASTGVIGQTLNIAAIEKGMPALVAESREREVIKVFRLVLSGKVIRYRNLPAVR